MRGRLIVALIAVLVVTDIVLVTLAVRRGHAGPVVVAHRTTNNTHTSTPARSATPPADTGRTLVAGADNVVLRATGGSCKTGVPAVLELSTDSGATFAPTAEDLGIAQVLRVAVEAASNVWFVGADDQCTTSIWRLDPAGTGWLQSPGTGGAWHLLPAAGRHMVHAPTGQVPVGCAVAVLSAVDGQTARVLCASGEVIGTADGGSSWVHLGRRKEAQLIAYDSSTNGVAIRSTPSCDVQALVTSDGGATWTPTACLQGTEAQALAYHNGALIALVDDTVRISGDGGQTWSTP
jgi:photosystem II stability/assembly factor-like uncharacterized protein